MGLLVEDVLLLLLDDETGDLRASSQADVALGGAVLAELAILGCATVPEKQGRLDVPQVHAAGPPPEHPLLAEAYAVVAERPRNPQTLAQKLSKGLRKRVAAELVGRGILREERGTWLGIVPHTRWPAADSAHEEEVRRRIQGVLLQGLEPDPHTGALIAILSALDVTHRVVDTQGVANREVRKRAKAVAEGEWAAKAVRDAIAATNAAMMAAVAVAAGGAASS